MTVELIKDNIVIYAIIAVFIVLLIASYFFGKKAMKKRGDKFLQQHPNAAKATYKLGVASEYTVHSVNEEYPCMFRESTRVFGVYLVPGENIIEVEYKTNRPGVVHKSVTTTYGPIKMKVNAEPYKTYEIKYNKSSEQFEFIEH